MKRSLPAAGAAAFVAAATAGLLAARLRHALRECRRGRFVALETEQSTIHPAGLGAHAKLTPSLMDRGRQQEDGQQRRQSVAQRGPADRAPPADTRRRKPAADR
jgi:hypothetical protein